MTDKKFSDFPLGNTSAFPEFAGLQLAANIRGDEAVLAYAIALALATVTRNIASLGSITASNLSGTNTGNQIASGVPYSNVSSGLSATNVQAALDEIVTDLTGQNSNLGAAIAFELWT